MNSALLVDETIRSGNTDVDSYISLLEGVVVAYTSDNATRMVAEANRVIGILADDLSLIAEDGSIKGTKLIKEEKNNMAMDRIVKLMKEVAAISAVSRASVSVGKEIAYGIAEKNKPEKLGRISKDDGEGDNELQQGNAGVDDARRIQSDSIQDEKDQDMINSGQPLIEQLMNDIKQNK